MMRGPSAVLGCTVAVPRALAKACEANETARHLIFLCSVVSGVESSAEVFAMIAAHCSKSSVPEEALLQLHYCCLLLLLLRTVCGFAQDQQDGFCCLGGLDVL